MLMGCCTVKYTELFLLFVDLFINGFEQIVHLIWTMKFKNIRKTLKYSEKFNYSNQLWIKTVQVQKNKFGKMFVVLVNFFKFVNSKNIKKWSMAKINHL